MQTKYYLTSDGQLYHHGIKGQKWGVRRYQNADGSLTAAGEKRYAKQEYKKDKKIRKQLERDATDTAEWLKTMKYNKWAYDNSKRTYDTDRDKDLQKSFRNLDTYYKALNKQRVEKAIAHVDAMKEKYQDKKIKDVNVKTSKNGEAYIHRALLSDGTSKELKVRNYLDEAGNKRYYLQPTRVRHVYI